MAGKNFFGKLVGTAFQAVGAAANVVGKAASAVGSAANAVGEEIAKNDEQENKPRSSANENVVNPALTSDVLTNDDGTPALDGPNATLAKLGLAAGKYFVVFNPADGAITLVAG